MPRRKKDDPGSIKENIIAYANERGFTEEFVVECLKNAIIKSYAKQFLLINDISGGIFDVELEDNNQSVVIYGRVVKDPDDIVDDFLEIDSDDDDVVAQGLKVGDIFYIREKFDDLEAMDPIKYAKFSRSWKTAFVNNITVAEKQALLEKYQSKIHDLVDAVVEKYNPEKNSYTVLVGKTPTKLDRRDLIGNERFNVGDVIKVYLDDIDVSGKSGTQGAALKVNRSSREFLKRVFELNVNEIYDGTVIIKNIAREAGVRSKVAVYSLDPNIDAKGACIGANGNRVQTIVQNNLGNAPEKEKIDIVNYSDNLALYLAEAFSPAVVTGVGITEVNGKKKANVVVRNGETSLVIGKGGVNVRLAAKLCGVDIQIFQQDEAWQKNIQFTTIADIKKNADLEPTDEETNEEIEITPVEEENHVEQNEVNEDVTEVAEQEDVSEAAEVEEKPAEVKVPVFKEEPKLDEKPVEHVDVKIKASISELESLLDAENEQKAAKQAKKSAKKAKKVEEKQEKEENKTELRKGMDIYTEEELEDIKAEEESEYEIDTDEYDDYDDDRYYDDDNL